MVQNNYIFNNWRNGTMQFWVPAALRDEQDPAKTYDTSANNRYQDNCMGVRPASLDPAVVDFTQCQGTRDPNGTDFWWDEEEGQDCVEEQPGCVDNETALGNCWVQTGSSRNEGPSGGQPSSDPPSPLLQDCPGPRSVPTRQLGQAGVAGPMRDLEPGESESARLRLVHASPGAELAIDR